MALFHIPEQWTAEASGSVRSPGVLSTTADLVIGSRHRPSPQRRGTNPTPISLARLATANEKEASMKRTALNIALGGSALVLALLGGAAIFPATASAGESHSYLSDGAPAALEQVRRRIWVGPAYGYDDAYDYDGPAYYPPAAYAPPVAYAPPPAYGYAPPPAYAYDYVPPPAYGYVPPVGYGYGPGPGVAVVGPRGGVYVGY